jgi:hypothetical protein
MSKGHVFLAQNSKTDYVFQAYMLALTIKKHNKRHNQTCLITNDAVPDRYKHVFDNIIEIPWNDSAENNEWKIENRWKIIHVSPFKENLVYDTDMLLMSSNDHWWDFLANKDVVLTSEVRTYRDKIVTSDFYRKAFTDNNLPNVYMGVHYFKKNRQSYEFYKWLEIITNNYNEFYDKFLIKSKQKFCSMDINAALAVKFMGAEEQFLISGSIPSFTHMKPAVQGWAKTPHKWQDILMTSYDDNLIIGNYLQTGIFHYTEDDFLNSEIVKAIVESYND